MNYGTRYLSTSYMDMYQTIKYVHITHNVSTHKFECPTEILTPDEGIYRKAAHIYVNG